MSKYEMIFKKILSDIDNEVYKAGDMLPGEYKLMSEYGASRDTIRKALSLLVQNGYIQKSKGRGSIVLDVNRFEFSVNKVISFKELKNTLGNKVETKVVCLEKVKPDQKIKKNLELSENDEVWIIQRVRIVDGQAIILDTDILNASIVPSVTMEIAQNSLYEYIEQDLGLKIAYAQKEITCQETTGMDKNLLDMMGFHMVVNVESKTYLDDAKVFQYTSSRHRPDKFRFKDFARRIHTV